MTVQDFYPADAWPPIIPLQTMSAAPRAILPGHLAVFAPSACPYLGSIFEVTMFSDDGAPVAFGLGVRGLRGDAKLLWYRADPPPWNDDAVSPALAKALKSEPNTDYATDPRFCHEVSDRQAVFLEWLAINLASFPATAERLRACMMMFELREAAQ